MAGGWRVEVGKDEELKGDFQVPGLVHWKLSNAIIIFSLDVRKVMCKISYLSHQRSLNCEFEKILVRSGKKKKTLTYL